MTYVHQWSVSAVCTVSYKRSHLEHVELRNGVFRPVLLVEMVEEVDVLLHALNRRILGDKFVVLEFRIQNLSMRFRISFE